MPYFLYVARDKNGKLINGEAFSVSQQQLTANLQRERMLVLSIKEAAAAADRTAKKIHKKARAADLILFAKEFAVLLENGISIMEALDVLLKQMNSTDLIKAIKAIRKELENGSTLANAIAKQPRIFGDLWQYLSEAGETSGQLPFVMRQMVGYLESQETLRKKIINAMIYPVVLLTVAFAGITIFTLKIIPVFKEIYATLGSGSKLPALTRFVIGIGDFVRGHIVMLVVIAAIIIFVFRQILLTRAGRRLFETLIFATPVIGELYTAIAIERFSTVLKVLLKSGIPIIKVIEMSANTSPSALFKDKLEKVKAKVTAGLSFAEALQQTAMFPPIAVQLVIVAEKTGNFAGMFEEVSKYYTEVLDTAISRFTTLIEPIMLIGMGFVIGIMVIAMFLPIFKLASL